MEPGVRRHGSQAVTTTTIVNKQFLEEHEQAVVEYLNMAGQSVAWTLANMARPRRCRKSWARS